MGLGDVVQLHDLRSDDPLENKLGDTVSCGDGEFFGTVVEDENPDVAGVVNVDDPGTDGNALIDGESRTRGDASVRTGRQHHLDARGDEGALAVANDDRLRVRSVEVVTGCTLGPPGRKPSERFVEFDTEYNIH